MAVIVTHPMEYTGGDSNEGEITLNCHMRVEGGSLLEIMNSNLIPRDNTRLPGDSRYILRSHSFEVVGNAARKVQCRVELTYVRAGANPQFGGTDVDGSKPPWELGGFNLSISSVSESAPFIYGFDNSGAQKDVINTAGCRILSETQRYLTQISFTYCVNAGISRHTPPINPAPTINAHNETVVGYSFAPFTALLQPMNAELVVEYDDKGRILQRYWQMSATIIYNPRTHRKELLNVGTMAKFPSSGNAPQPIYQYTPWHSKDDSQNINIRPVFGSIDNVVAAKARYANLFPPEEYKERFDMLPYHEITDPVPLDINGGVDVQALLPGGVYLKKSFFEFRPESWARYNLPVDRL